jgi:hypothetical protein
VVPNKLPLIFAYTLIFLTMLTAGCASHSSTSVKPTGEIHFLVNDSDIRPLQGAKVVSNEQPEGQLKLSGLTDAKGTIIFKNIKPGEYEFYISRFDYNQIQISITLTVGQITNLPVELELSNPQSTTTAPVTRISFALLIADPALYNDQIITLTGFWFDGFEIEVLAERLDGSDFAPGNVQPAGTKIWVKNGLPDNVNKLLYLQPGNPTGYPAHYGKVELTGILEFGGQYGHLNSYQYQLTVQSAQLITWSP